MASHESLAGAFSCEEQPLWSFEWHLGKFTTVESGTVVVSDWSAYACAIAGMAVHQRMLSLCRYREHKRSQPCKSHCNLGV